MKIDSILASRSDGSNGGNAESDVTRPTTTVTTPSTTTKADDRNCGKSNLLYTRMHALFTLLS